MLLGYTTPDLVLLMLCAECHNAEMESAFPNVDWKERWLPKSILSLRDYNLSKFLHDLVAGVTVGSVTGTPFSPTAPAGP